MRGTRIVGMSMAGTEHGEVWLNVEASEWTPILFRATAMDGNTAALTVEALKAQGVKAYSEPSAVAARRVLDVDAGPGGKETKQDGGDK